MASRKKSQQNKKCAHIKVYNNSRIRIQMTAPLMKAMQKDRKQRTQSIRSTFMKTTNKLTRDIRTMLRHVNRAASSSESVAEENKRLKVEHDRLKRALALAHGKKRYDFWMLSK